MYVGRPPFIRLFSISLCSLVPIQASGPNRLTTCFITAPLRLLLSFLIFFYTFFFSPSSPLYRVSSSTSASHLTHPSAHSQLPPGYRPSGWGGDALKNRVFLTFIFVEMVSWFWVWVTLREEKREVTVRKARGRRSSQGGYAQ